MASAAASSRNMTRPTPVRGRGGGAASRTSGAGCFFASGGKVVVPSSPPSRRGVSLSFLCAFMINAGHANDSGVPASLCVGLAASLAGDGRNAKHQGLRHSLCAVPCSITAAHFLRKRKEATPPQYHPVSTLAALLGANSGAKIAHRPRWLRPEPALEHRKPVRRPR